MKTATTIARMLVRLCGVTLIVLGVLLWTGHALSLIPLHMLLGLIMVLALWVLAGIAARAGLPAGTVVLAVVWGIVVLVLGMTQRQLLLGSAHWVIRVLHLLVGLGAMGQAEGLARRIMERISGAARSAV